MATRAPLVLVNGQVQRLPPGDDISGAVATPQTTLSNSNAGAITLGQAVYSDGAGSVDLARANAIATARAIGLVAAASIASAASGAIQYGGVATSADWNAVIGSTSLTPSARYYLDPTTAGHLTATAPDSAGQYVVGIGVALSTTELLIEIERPIGA